LSRGLVQSPALGDVGRPQPVQRPLQVLDDQHDLRRLGVGRRRRDHQVRDDHGGVEAADPDRRQESPQVLGGLDHGVVAFFFWVRSATTATAPPARRTIGKIDGATTGGGGGGGLPQALLAMLAPATPACGGMPAAAAAPAPATWPPTPPPALRTSQARLPSSSRASTARSRISATKVTSVFQIDDHRLGSGTLDRYSFSTVGLLEASHGVARSRLSKITCRMRLSPVVGCLSLANGLIPVRRPQIVCIRSGVPGAIPNRSNHRLASASR